MAQSSFDPAGRKPSRSPSRRPTTVLVVDASASLRETLQACQWDTTVNLQFADDMNQARASLTGRAVDLLVLGSDLTDQASLRLLREVNTHCPLLGTVIVSEKPSLDLALKAMRAGVRDVIPQPCKPKELSDRLCDTIEKVRREQKLHRRLKRLQKLCLKLNHARQEISQQVDVLCSDLVSAYQDLAAQMQQAVQTSEFTTIVRGELDLEQYVRKLLEFVLEKAGPTNAAIYLPAGGQEFALGGYVNYDLSAGMPELLLQQIGDRMVERVIEEENVRVVTGQDAIQGWLGQPIQGLDDCQVVTTACRFEEETLAVLVIFRHKGQPFAEDLGRTILAVRQHIGQGLARIIRVHHRHLPDDLDEGQGKSDAA